MGPGRSLPGPTHTRRRSGAPPIYGDASAITKFVLDEPESEALRAAVSFDTVITSRLMITEVHRAVRKKAVRDPTFRLAAGLMKAEMFLEELRMHPIEDAILRQAAAMVHPHLRSLDAIHVATALAVRPVAAFLTYDLRQAEAAQMVGFAVRSPGA